MHITELIERLQTALHTHGDLAVASCGDDGDLSSCPSVYVEGSVLVVGRHIVEADISSEE